MQWNNSKVTLNPPSWLNHPPSTTINTWNSSIPAFEYNDYLNFVGSNSTFRPNFTELLQLLSFDFLFSPLRIQQMIL